MNGTVSLADIRAVAVSTGYPTGKTNLIKRLMREGAVRSDGIVADGQTGFRYTFSSLPKAIQDRVVNRAEDLQSGAGRPFQHQSYLALPELQKAEAERRLRMMLALQALVSNGVSATVAYAEIAVKFAVSVPTVKRAWKAVRTADEGDWLDLLVKGYKGRKPDEMDARVWSAFVADYGRVEQPQLQATWERIGRQAKREGWGDIPSIQTFKRRWDALPTAQRVYMRNGEKALGQLFP